jgi:pilus assembly protein CpaF
MLPRLAVAARAGRATTEESDPARQARTAATHTTWRSKAALQERLLDEIGERGLLRLPAPSVAAAVPRFRGASAGLEDIALNEAERVRLAEELHRRESVHGAAGPAAGRPEAVGDILVNAHDQVYVERFGRLERTDVRFRDADHIVRVIERIAARVGRRIDTSSPMADLRLPDGSRVNATLPPVTIDGPTLSIRRFGRRRMRRDDLLASAPLRRSRILVFARARGRVRLRRHAPERLRSALWQLSF